MNRLRASILLIGSVLVAVAAAGTPSSVRVGSKKFTESVILGEMITQLARTVEQKAEHRAELGGSRILWNALIGDEIDVYPEYTGTLVEELLPALRGTRPTAEVLSAELGKLGLRMSAPLGFNNTYALGMRSEVADARGIRKISDLRAHPDLVLGFSNEFQQRADGWPKVARTYGLSRASIRGLDHDIGYRALESGDIQVIDLYSTDAEIAYYSLRVLEDDRAVFPPYEAVLVYRADLETRAPEALVAIRRLEGALTADQMSALNARAKLEGIPAAGVAQTFLSERLAVRSVVKAQSVASSMTGRLVEHLRLVVISMTLGILCAIPLGIWAARSPRVGTLILLLAGIIQTIPALALLVMLISPLKALGLPAIGDTPAVVALFLYSLLPMIRNTHAGLEGIPSALRESAETLGLPAWVRLRRIELPLASPLILAGIKTATVINIGFATLGALIGAGGFGQPILAGIRLDDYGLILQGAGPAAALALVTQLGFHWGERFWIPQGLRKGASHVAPE